MADPFPAKQVPAATVVDGALAGWSDRLSVDEPPLFLLTLLLQRVHCLVEWSPSSDVPDTAVLDEEDRGVPHVAARTRLHAAMGTFEGGRKEEERRLV